MPEVPAGPAPGGESDSSVNKTFSMCLFGFASGGQPTNECVVPLTTNDGLQPGPKPSYHLLALDCDCDHALNSCGLLIGVAGKPHFNPLGVGCWYGIVAQLTHLSSPILMWRTVPK